MAVFLLLPQLRLLLKVFVLGVLFQSLLVAMEFHVLGLYVIRQSICTIFSEQVNSTNTRLAQNCFPNMVTCVNRSHHAAIHRCSSYWAEGKSASITVLFSHHYYDICDRI